MNYTTGRRGLKLSVLGRPASARQRGAKTAPLRLEPADPHFGESLAGVQADTNSLRRGSPR
jgi:hypothetical protein